MQLPVLPIITIIEAMRSAASFGSMVVFVMTTAVSVVPADETIQRNQPYVAVLNDRITVVPFLVPHRDEYSETVGFRIRGPSRTVIYLPDIDKWERWEVAIEDLMAGADVAYLDGTFFGADELPGRDMSEIPHPFIVESIARFKSLPAKERNKVRFIHANHTNPILAPESAASAAVSAAGHHVAKQGERFGL